MKRFIEKATKVEDLLLMTCLGVMGAVLFAQVLFRYFFGAPIMWSEELSRYLQIWLTFLGIGYGLRHESHISMVLVYDRLPEKVKLMVKALTNVVMLVCFVYFIPASIRFVKDQHQILSSAMQLPMSIVYAVGPVGGVVYILYTVIDTVRDIMNVFATESKLIVAGETANE